MIHYLLGFRCKSQAVDIAGDDRMLELKRIV